jgi:hypothetical protein
VDIIILQDSLYQIIKVAESVPNCFDYCDIYREQFATYLNHINKWVMKDGGGIFYGCVCN